MFAGACLLFVALMVQPGSSFRRASAQGASRLLSREATLRDVCFVDAEYGWAAGDQGAIWHTNDGGRHWTLQHARGGVTLHDIHFVDRQRGWAVGGTVQPVTWRSIAVILKTTNGGRRWTLVPSVSLPELRAVFFASPDEGVAAGDVSSIYSTGVFRTHDGGRSWQAVTGRRRTNWRKAAWSDPDHGLVLGTDHLARFRAERLSADSRPAPGAYLRAVCHASNSTWLAAGDRGTLFHSRDDGRSWTALGDHLPLPFQDGPDFHTVATWESHIWLAGSPGSFVLHSSDGGETWEVFFTGQRLPLTSMTFVDSMRGWAVGAFGTILATRDGGKHWQIQRQRSDRVAWWSILLEQQEPPLPLMAQHAAQDGWIGGVTQIGTASELASSSLKLGIADRSTRMRQAVSLVGAGFSERVRFSGRIGADARASGGPPAENGDSLEREQRWRERIAWLLAQWRPETVFLGAWRTTHEISESRLLYRTLVELVQSPDLDRAFPQRLRAWGLEPWQPTKTIRVGDSRRASARRIPMGQFMPGLSRTIEDQTWEALNYLERFPRRLPRDFGWWLLSARNREAAGSRDLIDERAWPAGSALRRETTRLPWRLQRLNEVVQSLRSLDEILLSPGDFVTDANWFGRFQQLSRPLPASDAGNYLFRLALAAAESGHWPESFDIMTTFLKQYEAHPLTEGALWWLVRHRSSSEVRRASRGTSAPEPSNEAAVELMRDWIERLSARSLTYGRAPPVMLPLAAVERRAGRLEEAMTTLQPVSRTDAAGRFAFLARGEIWLQDRRGALTVPKIQAVRMVAPRLDGKLEDPAWKRIEPFRLRTPDGATEPNRMATEFRFGRDSEFLYLICRCPKRRLGRYQSATRRTARDVASTELDHIRIELDIDRDYCSAFELIVDCRGQVTDRVCGSAAWEPTWYVAVHETNAAWHVEAAIPLEELQPDESKGPRLWGLRVERSGERIPVERWPGNGSAPWGWLEFDHATSEPADRRSQPPVVRPASHASPTTRSKAKE